MRISRTKNGATVLVDQAELARWSDAHPGGGWHEGDAVTVQVSPGAHVEFSCTRWGCPWSLDHVDAWALEELAQNVLGKLGMGSKL